MLRYSLLQAQNTLTAERVLSKAFWYTVTLIGWAEIHFTFFLNWNYFQFSFANFFSIFQFSLFIIAF